MQHIILKKNIYYIAYYVRTLYILWIHSLSIYILHVLCLEALYTLHVLYIYILHVYDTPYSDKQTCTQTYLNFCIDATDPIHPRHQHIHTYPPPWPQGGEPLGGRGSVCLSVCIHMNACLYVWYSAIFLHKRGRHIERNSPSHGVGGPGSYVYI